jgi:hypothetical protein
MTIRRVVADHPPVLMGGGSHVLELVGVVEGKVPGARAFRSPGLAGEGTRSRLRPHRGPCREPAGGAGEVTGVGARQAEHLPGKPSWDCLVDGQPWPCDPAREAMARSMGPTTLLTYLQVAFGEAAEDLPTTPAGELYERFLSWPQGIRR